MRLLPAFAATFLLALASPALADQHQRMISDVQREAAWHGVEVNRIVRAGDKLLVEGIDRRGVSVTLQESCANSRIACLPDSVAGRPLPTVGVAN